MPYFRGRESTLQTPQLPPHKVILHKTDTLERIITLVGHLSYRQDRVCETYVAHVCVLQ